MSRYSDDSNRTSNVQQQDQSHFDRYGYIYSIGFFGGLFAAFAAFVTHLFGFIPFGPGVSLSWLPFYELYPWMGRYQGHLISILWIGVLSIPFAFLYYVLFRRFTNVWIGILFGFALWIFIFLVFNLLFQLQTMHELSWDSNITLISIFVLYGLFVGYSISYEANHGHNEGRA